MSHCSRTRLKGVERFSHRADIFLGEGLEMDP